MRYYQKISLFLAFIVGVMIFVWSNVRGVALAPSKFIPLAFFYHASVFFLFAGFLLVGLWGSFKIDIVWIALLLSFVYAALDELHQTFVYGRCASFLDLGYNFFGIFVALLFLVICYYFLGKE